MLEINKERRSLRELHVVCRAVKADVVHLMYGILEIKAVRAALGNHL